MASRPDEGGAMERIVVGLDDSKGARDALAWAIEEARTRGATLDVVHCWCPPSYKGLNREWPADEQAFIEDARKLIEGQLVQVAPDGVDVPLTVSPVEAGVPAASLIDHAKGADLLVVGARGHGGFARLLLGSISTQCVHHAHCTTVVVRSGPTR
jgi:nucleotide-binding universal stress UspA family protein